MPRASWRGFLRLSLVSCPIYLSPATTRTKPIRLHQVWQPAPVDVDEDDLPDLRGSAPSVTRLRADNSGADGDESPAATRIELPSRVLCRDSLAVERGGSVMPQRQGLTSQLRPRHHARITKYAPATMTSHGRITIAARRTLSRNVRGGRCANRLLP